MAPRTSTGDQEPVTLLYAGGLGSFYTMDSYLEAVAALESSQLSVDFVVRPAEVHRLEEMLRSRGLDEDPRVWITTEDLDVYIPRPGLTIGTVLLDSDYARFSFPFKTVSFLEKGFPVLTYRDMGLAEFVESAGVGVTCARDADATEQAIREMAATDWVQAITRAQQEQSWSVRLAEAEEAAQQADRRSGASPAASR